jgi:hypothetical protein
MYIYFTSIVLSAITFSTVSVSYILELFTLSVFKIYKKRHRI